MTDYDKLKAAFFDLLDDNCLLGDCGICSALPDDGLCPAQRADMDGFDYCDEKLCRELILKYYLDRVENQP